MPDTKITDLTELTNGNVAHDDVVPIVDVSGTATRKAKVSSIVGPGAGSDITGTTYTFALGDMFRTNVFNSASAQTVTVPVNASVPIPVGGRLKLYRKGTGSVKFVPDSGVTIQLPTGMKPKRTMGVRVKLASNLTGINATSFYTIGWNSELWDTDAFHDNVTNNSRLTIPSGLGIKKISLSASLYMSSLATNTIATIGITKNGSSDYDGFTQTFGTSTGIVTSEVSTASGDISVVDGDYFSIGTYTQDSSVTLEALRTGASLTVQEIDAQGFIAFQYGTVELEKIATNEWIVVDQSALG